MFVYLLLSLGVTLSTDGASVSPNPSWSNPVHACIWLHNDQVVSDVTFEECKEKCNSATSFVCKSVDYAVAGPSAKTCWLSKETRRSTSDFKMPCPGVFSSHVFSEKVGTSVQETPVTTADHFHKDSPDSTDSTGSPSDGDWTCDDCDRGSSALISYFTSSSVLDDQVLLLLTRLCPIHTDPVACRTSLPKFWTTFGKEIWSGFWLYLCLDKSCPSSAFWQSIHQRYGNPASNLTCKACGARVNGHAEYFDEPTIINEALNILDQFCASMDDTEDCKKDGKWLIPKALETVKEQPRDWINEICEQKLRCIKSD